MTAIDAVAKEIDEYAKQATALVIFANDINLPLNASPFYNFRDALNHYIRLYEAKEASPEYYSQMGSIREHLFRGLKDVIQYIATDMKYRLKELADNPTIDIKRKNETGKLLHKYKNFELQLRNNAEASVIRELTPQVNTLQSLIAETFDFFDKNNLSYLKTKRSKRV